MEKVIEARKTTGAREISYSKKVSDWNSVVLQSDLPLVLTELLHLHYGDPLHALRCTNIVQWRGFQAMRVVAINDGRLIGFLFV